MKSLGHNKLDSKLDILQLATADIEEQSEVSCFYGSYLSTFIFFLLVLVLVYPYKIIEEVDNYGNPCWN